MKLTNKHKLPQIIYDFLKQDFYDHEAKGDSISATSLLKPTQQLELEKRHEKEIEIDCLDRMWSLFGSGIHAVLEKMKDQEPIERLRTEVEGKTVSGKYDVIKDNIIRDWKVTSAFTLAYGSRTEEWRDQLSIYRWLYFKQKGIKLSDKGYIEAILRDWAERDATRVKNYPKTPVVEIEIDLLNIEDTEKMVVKKIKEINKYEILPDDQLPKCTDEERWWNDAKQIYIKCEKYCPARSFCKQAQQEFEKR